MNKQNNPFIIEYYKVNLENAAISRIPKYIPCNHEKFQGLIVFAAPELSLMAVDTRVMFMNSISLMRHIKDDNRNILRTTAFFSDGCLCYPIPRGYCQVFALSSIAEAKVDISISLAAHIGIRNPLISAETVFQCGSEVKLLIIPNFFQETSYYVPQQVFVKWPMLSQQFSFIDEVRAHHLEHYGFIGWISSFPRVKVAICCCNQRLLVVKLHKQTNDPGTESELTRMLRFQREEQDFSRGQSALVEVVDGADYYEESLNEKQVTSVFAMPCEMDMFLYAGYLRATGQDFYPLIQNMFELAQLAEKMNVSLKDYKPENLLINIRTLKVVLIDLESITRIRKGGPTASIFMCTRYYAAPQRFDEEIDEDGRKKSDSWSVAVSIHKILFGTLPQIIENSYFVFKPTPCYIDSTIQHLLMNTLKYQSADRWLPSVALCYLQQYKSIIKCPRLQLLPRMPEFLDEFHFGASPSVMTLLPFINLVVQQNDENFEQRWWGRCIDTEQVKPTLTLKQCARLVAFVDQLEYFKLHLTDLHLDDFVIINSTIVLQNYDILCKHNNEVFHSHHKKLLSAISQQPKLQCSQAAFLNLVNQELNYNSICQESRLKEPTISRIKTLADALVDLPNDIKLNHDNKLSLMTVTTVVPSPDVHQQKIFDYPSSSYKPQILRPKQVEHQTMSKLNSNHSPSVNTNSMQRNQIEEQQLVIETQTRQFSLTEVDALITSVNINLLSIGLHPSLENDIIIKLQTHKSILPQLYAKNVCICLKEIMLKDDLCVKKDQMNNAISAKNRLQAISLSQSFLQTIFQARQLKLIQLVNLRSNLVIQKYVISCKRTAYAKLRDLELSIKARFISVLAANQAEIAAHYALHSSVQLVQVDEKPLDSSFNQYVIARKYAIDNVTTQLTKHDTPGLAEVNNEIKNKMDILRQLRVVRSVQRKCAGSNVLQAVGLDRRAASEAELAAQLVLRAVLLNKFDPVAQSSLLLPPGDNLVNLMTSASSKYTLRLPFHGERLFRLAEVAYKAATYISSGEEVAGATMFFSQPLDVVQPVCGFVQVVTFAEVRGMVMTNKLLAGRQMQVVVVVVNMDCLEEDVTVENVVHMSKIMMNPLGGRRYFAAVSLQDYLAIKLAVQNPQKAVTAVHKLFGQFKDHKDDSTRFQRIFCSKEALLELAIDRWDIE